MVAGRRPTQKDLTPVEPDPNIVYKKPVVHPRFVGGWPSIARCIVTELGHLLPPRTNPWPAFIRGGRHRFRDDGTFEINVQDGTWRDHRSGAGGGIYSLLVRLLGSQRDARQWIADEDPAAAARRAETWWKLEYVPTPASPPIAAKGPEPVAEPCPQLSLWEDAAAAQDAGEGTQRSQVPPKSEEGRASTTSNPSPASSTACPTTALT